MHFSSTDNTLCLSNILVAAQKGAFWSKIEQLAFFGFLYSLHVRKQQALLYYCSLLYTEYYENQYQCVHHDILCSKLFLVAPINMFPKEFVKYNIGHFELQLKNSFVCCVADIIHIHTKGFDIRSDCNTTVLDRIGLGRRAIGQSSIGR